MEIKKDILSRAYLVYVDHVRVLPWRFCTSIFVIQFREGEEWEQKQNYLPQKFMRSKAYAEIFRM